MSAENNDVARIRRCTSCRREWPLNGAHFHRHARHKSGIREFCKACRSWARKNSRQEQYVRAERTLILKYARDIHAGVSIPSHEELHRALSKYLGCTEGIAKSFYRHFTEAKPGCRLAVAMILSITELSVRQEQRQK